VARAITKLGGEAICLYPAGGSTGKQLKRMLDAEGVLSVVVDIDGDTRENLIVTDITSGLQYQLNMPGPVLGETAITSLLSIIALQEGLQYMVVSGSLPPGMPGDIFGKLAAIAGKKNIRIIADTPGDALKKALQYGVYLIKPSIHELIAVAEKGGEEQSIETLAKALVD